MIIEMMFDLKLMTSWNSIFIHSTEIEKEAYFIHIKTIQIANSYVFPDHKRTCFHIPAQKVGIILENKLFQYWE